jgi:trigger factor
VSVESVGNLERRMTFRLPAERLEDQVGGRLREIARTARIKGFRPGKVPARVIEQRFGQQVRDEVLDGLLREGFDEAVRENALRLAGSPKIERSEDGGDRELAYVATFEVVPDFGEIDVSKLNVTRHTSEVTEADIEQALVGMQTGDEKTVDVTFPADWRVAQLAGKSAQVHVKIEQVSEQVLPEADAAFIRSFGVKSGELDQFRADIRTNLERELKGALMNRLRRAVGEQLAEAYAGVELPPRLVEQEARGLLRAAQQQAAQQGRPGPQGDNAHEQFMEPARKRVLVALLVGEIARRNDLRLEPARLNELMRLIASTYEEPQQVLELYQNDPQLMAGLRNRAMEEQVIDWIAERAQHTVEPMTFQEAIG